MHKITFEKKMPSEKMDILESKLFEWMIKKKGCVFKYLFKIV